MPTIKSVRALPEFLKYMNPWLAGVVSTGLLAVAFVTILLSQLGSTALVVATTIWFFLKDPFGIDNMYIAVAAPLLCMLISNVFKKREPGEPLESVAHQTGGD